MRRIAMITTSDNPWNPFTNFTEWYMYDMDKGYDTCGRLSKLAPIDDTFPINIKTEILDEAHEKMIKQGAFDKNGNFVDYKLVYKDESDQ